LWIKNVWDNLILLLPLPINYCCYDKTEVCVKILFIFYTGNKDNTDSYGYSYWGKVPERNFKSIVSSLFGHIFGQQQMCD